MSRTVLVAFEVEADTHTDAQRRLMQVLPKPGAGHVECWWIAEDNRIDGSDCDSAVFVYPNHQQAAFGVLLVADLTDDHNRPTVGP